MTVPWADEGRLTADGKSLEYRCFGPPPNQAPTLVLLHEGLGCVALWRGFPEALAEATGLGVVAYSRAGYGQSDPADLPRPLDYMTREAVDVLPVVLNELGISRAILLGHSDGATIASIYAGSVFDARIRGLILMAPHFFTEAIGLAAIERARDAFANGGLREKLAKYHSHPDVAFRGWCDAWLHPDFKDWDVTDAIDHLRVPTLAIQGTGDAYGTLDQIEVLEARSYAPVDSLILENCGHSPFIDQPDAVLAGVTDFCTRLARIEAAV